MTRRSAAADPVFAPRCGQVGELRRRLGAATPRLVGLFADQPVDDVNRTMDRCGFDLAQLCGDETPVYWKGVEAPIIKQIKVRELASRDETVARTLRSVEEAVERGHLDRPAECGADRGQDQRCHDVSPCGLAAARQQASTRQ